MAVGYTRRQPAEDPTIDLDAAVRPYLVPITIVLAIGVLVLVGVAIVQARRVGRLRQRLEGITRGNDGRSLEAILDAHLERVHAVGREVEVLGGRTAALEATALRTLQRVGLVRFNPFEDTGGNQSFALTVLDERGNGFVVSSLHSRSGTRIYAKAVAAGQAEGALSGEEAEALRIALVDAAKRA